MQFQLTTAGQIAATNAKGAGLSLVFSDFEVGSAYGYTPTPAETGIHGALLYTGQITNYAQTAEGNLQFQMILDQTVGDFEYGEMAIRLADGTLFALGVLPKPQQKYATPSASANQIVETCQVVLSAGVPYIEWVVQPLTVGSIPEIATFDLLTNPTASTSNTNIVHTPDDYGNHSVVYTQGSAGIWEVSTYQYRVYQDTVQAASPGNNTFFGHVQPAFGAFPLGRYIIQFTSGASKGLIRQVTAVNGAQITMGTALGISAGDAFNVYQSTCSFIAAQATPFTPVQQGGGVGQLATKVYIGDNGTGGLAATVNTTNLGNFVFSAELQSNVAAINTQLGNLQTQLNGKQPLLGFTPVQQGGGNAQLTNKIYMGWDGSGTRLQVDASDQGRIAMQNQLSAVAFSGQWVDILNKPSFAAVATSGNYNDLVNRPALAAVALSGNYNDLINRPTPGGLGLNQSWQNVTGNRSSGTSFVNSTPLPIFVSIMGPDNNLAFIVDGQQVATSSGYMQGGAISAVGAIVPPGSSYALSGSFSSWFELR